jgi:Zn-dependent protease
MSTTYARQLTFSQRELLDLGLAWLLLSIAFTIFLIGPERLIGNPQTTLVLIIFSGLTVCVGFLLHELAHKVVAVHFGQVAEFRADYGMLFVAVMSALAGFIFAAPGAVHHTGRISERQHGLIAVAGPVVNLALVPVFGSLLFVGGAVTEIGRFGVFVNAFLAAFNMLPFGSLDGKTVKQWDLAVFAVLLTVSIVLLVGLFRMLGSPL